MFVLVAGGLVVVVVGYRVVRGGDRYEPASTPIHQFEMVDDLTIILHYTTGGCSGGIDHVDQDVSERQLDVRCGTAAGHTTSSHRAVEAVHLIELDEALRDRILLDVQCDSPGFSARLVLREAYSRAPNDEHIAAARSWRARQWLLVSLALVMTGEATSTKVASPNQFVTRALTFHRNRTSASA